MAKRRARIVLMSNSIGEPEEDTRRPGPLLNDRHPWSGASREDPLTGGQMFCSEVTVGRGVSKEPPRIKTTSSWQAHHDAADVFIKREHTDD